MTDELKRALRVTRDGYDAECELHRLFLDAYSGGGGFAGSVKQPTAGFWGAGAELYNDLGAHMYSGYARHTYVDRFPREDTPKFKRRVEASHYSNYIKPLTSLKLSYIFRKEFSVEDRPELLEEWRQDINGRGMAWEDMLPTIALRSAVTGWCPVVVDMPPAPKAEDGSPLDLTRADANQLGLRPAVIPLFPANLVDYQCDDVGDFIWAKVRTDHVEQGSPFKDKVEVTRYTVWYPNSFSIYEIVKDDKNNETARTVAEDEPHPFGKVPIAILQHTPMPDDHVKGIAMHGDETIEAKAHFNRQSELNEHMRQQVFALLVLATDANEELGEVKVGTDNAIALDPNSTQKHYYLSPDQSVAGTYETRLENSVQEMYRQARVEFSRPTASRQAISGIARKFEFAQTDRALSDFAKQIGRFEEDIDLLVGRGLGIADETIAKENVTPPTTFDVEDLATDIDIATSAISMDVGPTAERLIIQRLVFSMLPNLSDGTRTQIEEELLERETQKAQDAAANRALADSLDEEEDEPPVDDDEPPVEE